MPTDVILMSGGAADGLVTALLPGFRTETGGNIDGRFGAVGAMLERLRAGEAADVVILTRPIIDQLARDGVVTGDSVRDIGLVRTALAVRTGDALPDVTRAESLQAALLAADEIHFPDPALATAGIHFAGVLGRLGIAGDVAAAQRIHPNGTTAMHALAASTARAPIGCTQVTEILNTPGARLVGPLPDDLGLATIYTAAVLKSAMDQSLAGTFIEHLTRDASAHQRRQAGFE